MGYTAQDDKQVVVVKRGQLLVSASGVPHAVRAFEESIIPITLVVEKAQQVGRWQT